MEELSLIKVLKKRDEAAEKLSDKYAGKLPTDIAEQLQQHINQMKNSKENKNV